MGTAGRYAEQLLLREQFLNIQTTVQSGWVPVGAPTINRGLKGLGGTQGAEYPTQNEMQRLLFGGGWVRVRFNNTSGDGSARRVFSYTDGNYSIHIANRASDVVTFGQVRFGAGSSYYNIVGPVATAVEVVLLWDPITTTASLYIDGVFRQSDSTPGTASLAEDTTQRVIKVGSSSGANDFIGNVDFVEVGYGTLTPDEIAALHTPGTLFPYLQDAEIVLPMRSQTVAGGLDTTPDASSNGHAVTVGDGISANQPTFNNPGFETNGTSYLRSGAGILGTGSSPLTLWAVVRLASTPAEYVSVSYENQALSSIGGVLLSTTTEWRYYQGALVLANSSRMTARPPRAGHLAVVVGTGDGTTTLVYVDGEPGVVAATPLGATLTTDMELRVFQHASGGSPCPSGTAVYVTGVMKRSLTPVQVRDLTDRLLAEYSRYA